MTEELEPITPSEAKETFLTEKRGRVAERTGQADDSRLRDFVQRSEDTGLDSLK